MTDGCAHEATHQAGDIILVLRMVLIWRVKEKIALWVLPESVHTRADRPKCLDSTCSPWSLKTPTPWKHTPPTPPGGGGAGMRKSSIVNGRVNKISADRLATDAVTMKNR